MQLCAEAVLRRTRGDAYGQLNSALPCLSRAIGVLVGKKIKQGAWTNALAGFATLNFATPHKMAYIYIYVQGRALRRVHGHNNS